MSDTNSNDNTNAQKGAVEPVITDESIPEVEDTKGEVDEEQAKGEIKMIDETNIQVETEEIEKPSCCGNNCLGVCDWWHPSYVLDYVGIVTVCILLLVTNIVDWGPKAPIFLSDRSIHLPLHEDTVSMVADGLMAVIPACLLGFFFFFVRRDKMEDLHSFFLAVVGAVVLAYLVWAIMGKAVGELRPDFLARCAPACFQNYTWVCAPDSSKYTSDCADESCCPVQCNIEDPRYPEILPCPIGNQAPNLEDVCAPLWDVALTEEQLNCFGNPGTGGYDEFAIKEGYRSLPSGHTLVIFAVATSMWLYSVGKFQLYGRGIQQRMYCYGYLVASFEFVLATYVGVSRLGDNKHHMHDVLLGAIIGILPAFFVYFIYFQNPYVGGEPIRRVRSIRLWDIVLCRTRAMQQPWPAANTHFSDEEKIALLQPENDDSCAVQNV